MTRVTKAQHKTLKKMPRYRVTAQFTTGAIVVVSEQQYQEARVVDTDGRIYSFSRYLLLANLRL